MTEEDQAPEEPDKLEQAEKALSEAAAALEIQPWVIPATTLVILNSLEEPLRQASLDYVQKHQLTKVPTSQLARVLRSGEHDLIDPLLAGNISPATASKLLSVADPTREHMLQELILAQTKREARLLKTLLQEFPSADTSPVEPPIIGEVLDTFLSTLYFRGDFDCSTWSAKAKQYTAWKKKTVARMPKIKLGTPTATRSIFK